MSHFTNENDICKQINYYIEKYVENLGTIKVYYFLLIDMIVNSIFVKKYYTNMNTFYFYELVTCFKKHFLRY